MKVSLEHPDAPDHELIWGSVGLFLLAGGWALPLVPTLTAMGYVCPFHAITGLPCPTCGATRAVTALGSLDFPTALRLNPGITILWTCTHLYVPYALCVSLLDLPRIRIAAEQPLRDRSISLFLLTGLVLNWSFLIAERCGAFG